MQNPTLGDKVASNPRQVQIVQSHMSLQHVLEVHREFTSFSTDLLNDKNPNRTRLGSVKYIFVV